MVRKLPRALKPVLGSLAPLPMLWPLLADALRESPPMVQFGGMLDELRLMKDVQFQRAVLGGAFKEAGSVDGLISGEQTLAQTVVAEPPAQNRLLGLVGLVPFRKNSPGASAFERIINDAEAYRTELALAVEAFWNSAFGETWESLRPGMVDTADRLEEALANSALDEFARTAQLPVAIGHDAVSSIRGTLRVALKSVDGIHVIPSAFNSGRFWAAYTDASARTRFFIPLLNRDLAPGSAEPPDPSLAFKALGDTTRYAIASMIARTPMTSVDLARVFGVSKPTISHHVQQLRSAGLLNETPTADGVLLELDRGVLERVSRDAAELMFSETGAAPDVRRSRRVRKQ